MGRMDKMVAIVTGASRGLGRAIATEYARQQAKVVICARLRSPTGLNGTLETTAAEIQAEGGEVFPVACDVTDEAQVFSMIQQVNSRYGHIDVLVNNAGCMVLGEPILEIEPVRWEHVMATNVTGPYLVTRAVLPSMIAQHNGSIINIGTGMAQNPKQGGGVLYSTSKAALHMFSYTLAEEVQQYNIAVNILSPGAIKTEGSAVLRWAKPDWHTRVDPETVGPSAVFLALQNAESLTGQLLFRADFGKTWGI